MLIEHLPFVVLVFDMSLKEKEAGRESFELINQFRFHEKIFVPSNEHAAEVIGKGGHKIKKIAKCSRVIINCPNPEDHPIFEIMGDTKESVSHARKLIQHHANHFDKMRNKKRKIELKGDEVVRTVVFTKNDVPCIIGRHGRQIKMIVHHSQVKVISPDTNKEPIFILHGKEKDIEKCIFLMKIILLCLCGSIYITQGEYLIINEFLESPSSVVNDFFEDILIFVNFNSLRSRLRNLKFNQLHRDPVLTADTFMCWHCKEKKGFFAKGLCGHMLCCDKCISTLFADIYFKCFRCFRKIETFLIIRV
jgi:polyribonucleotide nucleotidyltransferase